MIVVYFLFLVHHLCHCKISESYKKIEQLHVNFYK